MILADVLATSPEAAASPPLAELRKRLRQAERFVFDLDAAAAAWDVSMSRPSSILSAIHLRRPPFPTTWIEYPHLGLARSRGRPTNPASHDKPTPPRVGFLIETVDFADLDPTLAGEAHIVTVAWGGPEGVGISPLAVTMRPEGDAAGYLDTVGTVVRTRAGPEIDAVTRAIGGGGRTPARPPTLDDVRRQVEAGGTRWRSLPEGEREALLHLQGHWQHGIAPCWATFLVENLIRLGPAEAQRRMGVLMRDALADIEGEPALLSAMLLLLNSRNAVAVEREDLARLNRARAKAGKRPLLDRSTVRISLSAVQARRAYGPAGAPGAGRRLHLVRGHFKVRKGGVYFWNAYFRGDVRLGGVERNRYEVST